MKRIGLGMALTVVLGVFTVQAQASSILTINVDGQVVTCNNSGACGAGFTTTLNSNQITFSGTVNGVFFSQVFLTGNSPGSAAIAFTVDTKTAVTNFSGVAHTITIDTGQSGFTLPVGSGFLSASQTANWTTTPGGDSQAFQSWLRNTNDLIIPGGTATAISPNCVSVSGQTTPCSQSTADVAVSPTSPYAITSREVI